MTNREKYQQTKTAVYKQRKRIGLWRRLNVSWKGILKELQIECNERTLANHFNNRGTL